MNEALYLAGWLIDGTGAPARHDMLMRVDNGCIISTEPVNAAELRVSGISFVDYSDCTIVPGLTDCHVHLSLSGRVDRDLREKQLHHTFEQNAPLIEERIRKGLARGIMALRDGGDAGGHALRFAAQAPRLPTLKVHLRCSGSGWRARGRYGKLVGNPPASGETLAEAIARRSSGASQVKILNSGLNSLTEFGRQTASQFSLDELRAAVRVAKSREQRVMVHANGILPVELAIEAGCDSIEHGFFMGDDNLRKMADRRVFWAPTCYTMQALGFSVKAGSIEADIVRRNVEHQLAQMSRARTFGVPIAAGTDAGSFGVRHGTSLAMETGLLMDGGFSAEEAIRCASLEGARLLGLADEMGRIHPGMPASFVVLEGPPSAIPESMGKPEAVYLKGERIT